MTAIWYVIQGWLGMVVRPAVLLQVLVILAMAFGSRALLLQPRLRRAGRIALLVRLGCLAGLALAQLLFMALGMAAGLIGISAQLVLVSVALELLRLLLRRWLAPAVVEQFW
ncbi:MAG: hypothetical protein VKM01_01770, partial [Cyanobacteriota bacterium]|nr:hypothetical protein [Cyanobacteriota bacterium]